MPENRPVFHAASLMAWAITEDYLRAIMAWANDERPDSEVLARIEALSARRGTDMAGHPGVTMRGDVAIIPILGPVFPRANLFTDISGATSTESLSLSLGAALDNPAVRSIALRIDSPGGAATGINELAKMIRAGTEKKTIVAYVEGQAASAAYWLASAADRIVVDDLAWVGNIGTVLSVRPPDANSKTIEIVSSQSPNKRPDPTTDTGRALFQVLADDSAQVFIESVAQYRGITPEKVVNDFGAGWMAVGRGAVQAGMADAVGTFEGVLTELAARKPAQPRPAAIAARTTTGGASMSGISAWDKFKAAMGAPIEAEGETQTATLTVPAISADADRHAAMAADLAAQKAALDEREAQVAAAVAQVRQQQAETFAAAFVTTGKITPAESALVASVHLNLGSSGDGLQALSALIEARPSHGLTGEKVSVVVLGDAPTDDESAKAEAGGMTMTSERRAELMAKSRQ